MRRRRSRSRSRGSSRSRNRRSPSEYRSMTRSRSPSPTRSEDRSRPPRSKYHRSPSSSRSPSPASVGGRPPSQAASTSGGGRPPSVGAPISTVDLTRSDGAGASWLNSMGQRSAPLPNFNNPPPSFSNPPMGSNPIPSVGQVQQQSQHQLGFPTSSQPFDNNFSRDFSGFGSSLYPEENRNYPDSQQQNNFGAPPGQNFGSQMGGGGWNYPGNGSSQSGFVREFPNPNLAAGPGAEVPHGGIPPPAADPGMKNAAVEQELVQQKKTLAVQREEYFKKRIAMTKDLKALREQADSLIQLGGSASKGILKENNKLQEEMLQKIKSMDNVIDMLTHIIGDREQIADLLKGFATALEVPKKPERPVKVEHRDQKPEKRRRSKSRSRSKSPKGKKKSSSKKKSATPEVKVNVEHYDPELHWCSVCNVFPRSATEYLTHLHSDVHRMGLKGKKAQERPEEEFRPWRVNEPREPSPPTYKNAPCKRVPIRGVPFLVPATAWYCGLCKTWLGELELAERHLRGPKHATNYTEFVSQNPHWEVDWLRDRTRAYEKNSEARAKVEEISKQLSTKKENSAKEVNLNKLKEMLASVRKKAEKKKERSDSSSSSSQSSSSEESDSEKKKAKKKKGKEEEKKKNKKKSEAKDEENHENRKGAKKERRSRERSESRERVDRPERKQFFNRRGRGRPFRGRFDRGGRRPDRFDRTERDWREGRERQSHERESKESDGGKTPKETPERKTSPFRSEHDWDRGKPVPKQRPTAKAPVFIGKRPGISSSQDRFGFQRKNVFDRLDKNKPDDLYGPLEPPVNE